MRALKGVRRPGTRARVAPSEPLRRDPAPSRIAYRLNRLWLRPRLRRAVTLWLPAAAAAALLFNWATQDARLQQAEALIAGLREHIETRPEFMVRLMAVDGASDGLQKELREIMPVEFPVSSFDLDLESLRDQIEALDRVKAADIRIRAGGILQIDLQERLPALVWRDAEGLWLVDDEGVRVDALDARADHPDLPLIVGAGADQRVSEALEIIRTAAPIRDRLIGLVRVSGLRWDLMLEDRMRIQLPEDGALVALDRVIALHEAQGLLRRDLSRIDMRNPDRPTLRLSPHAVDEMRKMRGLLIAREEGADP